MVTKESLLQEMVERYKSSGYYTELSDEELCKNFANMSLWSLPAVCTRFIDPYIRGLELGFYAFDDTLSSVLDRIFAEMSRPLESSQNDMPITVYRNKEVLLPNREINTRAVKSYTYKESNFVITDAYTGEVIQPDELMVRYKDGFVKVSNLDESFFICEDCNRLFSANETDYYGNNIRVCQECYDRGWWSVCEHCGEVVADGDAWRVNTRCGEEYWCEECRSSDAYYCECCGEYFDDSFDMLETSDGEEVCECCASDYYRECEECGELVHEDHIYWDDDDRPLCRSCYRDLYGSLPNEYERVIDNYHTHHNNHNKTYGESDKRMGIELEVEGAGKSAKQLNEMAKKVIEMATDKDGNRHINCENDGSLCGGFENITNPHTPEELFKLPWREILQTLIDNGYTSHNNGRCGLHIHFSNEWFGDDYDEIDDNVAKVVHFYSENYETMFKLSRRTTGSAESWARRFRVDDFEDSKIMKSSSTGHGTAVNLGNMNTIHTVEFRLGRGTLLYDSFMAWIDIHLAIVRNVRNIAKNDTDINKWFAGISEATKEYIKNKADIEIVDAEREVA